jgi:hypothetical protein
LALGNLVLPGLGTLVSGRRVVGALQLILSQTGFVLAMSWGVWFVAVWIRSKELPTNLGPLSWSAVAGLILFFGGWLWAFVSSLQILAGARKTSA